MQNEIEPPSFKTNEEEKKKLYTSVIQNIKKTLESTKKLELDAQKASSNLKAKLESKLKKERELTDAFKAFKKEIIAKAMSLNRNRGSGDVLNESLLADFEKEEERKTKEIDAMRLSLINTKMNVQKLEKKLKSKQKLDEELDILGFEQLQSQNKILKKKLGERQKEIERYRTQYENNISTISDLEGRIKTVKTSIHDHETSIQTVVEDISQAGVELSTLTKQHKKLEKKFKVQSTLASNKIVHDHYLSSKEEIKTLISTLENLKRKYHSLT